MHDTIVAVLWWGAMGVGAACIGMLVVSLVDLARYAARVERAGQR